MTRHPWGVYVHVPWCRRRCPYCAFYVDTRTEIPWTAYVGRVLREWEVRRLDGRPDTLFLGGGTPSRMPTDELGRLVAGIGAAEVSAEANPEDVTDAWLAGAIAAGVHRLSLGVQTFNPAFARLLFRTATVPEARQTARRVAASGLRSWSVDVLFALPGQTLDALRVDLDAILEVAPPHVSLYGLTFEPGTPFERGRERGVLVPPDEETWRAMYELLVDRLEAAGLARYEVSNFARPGHESTHNRLYWTDRPYVGLGPSAHGYGPDGSRWVNVADVDRYLAEDDPTEVLEHPTPREAAVDLLVSALRSREGVDLVHLGRRTGHAIPDAALRGLEDLVRREGDRLVLTREGYPVADGVTRHLADRLQPHEPAADGA